MKAMTIPPKVNPTPKIHPYVQRMIAGTNGNMYVEVVNQLKTYPIPAWPMRQVAGGLLLDIGCGWGRWLVSAAQAGFFPIGMDIKLEAALAAKQVLKDYNLRGFTVVADLKTLPFQSDTFDLVWSYSVIQHVHRKTARECLDEVVRVLRPGAQCLLEFPTSGGYWNRRQVEKSAAEADDIYSWCVRYYSIKELENLFLEHFGNFGYRNHCYFGIGIQPVDLLFVPIKYRPVILASLILNGMSRLVPLLKRFSDSVYVSATKSPENRAPKQPPHAVDVEQMSQLAFFNMLRCPATKQILIYDEKHQELVCEQAGLAYPIQEGVPILLAEKARRL